MSNNTQLERIAALEVQVSVLQAAIQESMKETAQRHKNMEDKLDELLYLKHKGMGAFWLASSLVGTGIISLFWAAIEWVKS